MKHLIILITPFLLLLGHAQPAKKYNVLSTNCYDSRQAAQDAFDDAMVDVKRCHFVDEQSSGVTCADCEGPNTPPHPPRYCYTIYGW